MKMIIKFSIPACYQSKFVKKMTKTVIFSFLVYNSNTQMLIEYKSGLPDFLLSFVDSIIKTDTSQILRYNFLHYDIDTLMREDVPRQDAVCVFFDPEGVNNIFIQNIKNYTSQFPMRTPQSFKISAWDTIATKVDCNFHYSVNPFFLKFLNLTQLQRWAKQKIITIDQIRVKCIANIYMDPEHIITDIFRVIAWNQIFRAKSANSFIYLNKLVQNIFQIINKKKIHKRFFNIKTKDFEKLLTYELRYKTNYEVWPYVPSIFREYDQIDHYVPTPQKRSEIIKKRLHTKKMPVQCPPNCVCYVEEGLLASQEFCKYSLKDGWVSSCPNRTNKIQCSHQSQQNMKKCRNAEIKKCQRKKCKKDEDMDNTDSVIEQCIMWGIDLYTRNLIFHSLPEVDINLNEHTLNKQHKNNFIEEALSKAINFNGKEGYSLKKACQLIINGFEKSEGNSVITDNSLVKDSTSLDKKATDWEFVTWKKNAEEQQSVSQQLFSKRDKLYAQVLLKNYEFCTGRIDSTVFRIHTKGKGAKCISKEGIKQGSFIVQYYGELYETWRWYEREDFIKQVMKKKRLKNFIPQFYNIYLEPHKDDPQGYDLMVVDPNRKGNYSSRFSHSCNPNCGTVTTVSDGKYYIGMYSFRDIKYGEELTFDYCCMTESNFQHINSICLCGTHKCRGNYLELANSRTYSQLVDKNTCFFSRNSLILQALQPFNQDDKNLCALYNIKDRMLSDSPEWMKKWMAKLLRYIQSQSKLYKKQLIQKWTKDYPWQPSDPQTQAANIELFSQTSKNDLLQIRFQNLFTTVDKLKYFLNTIGSKDPPLHFLNQNQIVQFMITHKESILKQIQEVMIQQVMQKQSFLIQKFVNLIKATQQSRVKLFYFRLCCLCISHMCMHKKPTQRFNSILLADVIYFYAFTHTYFTANEYSSHISEEIKVNLSEITGKPCDSKHSQKIKKRYSSQFVWGQLASWYKQTIVNPEASLSQDRRGTLSYPMIKSTINSCYPFEKHCRANFIKALRQKSASCWPSAPDHGCLLSFKNPFKCYGTVFFQSVHNAEKFTHMPGGSLQQSVLNSINKTFQQKLALFKNVQSILSGIDNLHEAYNILNMVSAEYFSFADKIPQDPIQQLQPIKTKKKKSKQSS